MMEPHREAYDARIAIIGEGEDHRGRKDRSAGRPRRWIKYAGTRKNRRKDQDDKRITITDRRRDDDDDGGGSSGGEQHAHSVRRENQYIPYSTAAWSRVFFNRTPAEFRTGRDAPLLTARNIHRCAPVPSLVERNQFITSGAHGHYV